MTTKGTLYQRRFEAALAELERAGIVGLDALPPYARLLRASGLAPRPLHYVPLTQFAFGVFVTFGLGLTLFGLWSAPNQAEGGAPFYAILAGSMIPSGLFATVMTAWTYWTRRSAGLSRWEDLDAAAQ